MVPAAAEWVGWSCREREPRDKFKLDKAGAGIRTGYGQPDKITEAAKPQHASWGLKD
jgi:hypothetical protein